MPSFFGGLVVWFERVVGFLRSAGLDRILEIDGAGTERRYLVAQAAPALKAERKAMVGTPPGRFWRGAQQRLYPGRIRPLCRRGIRPIPSREK